MNSPVSVRDPTNTLMSVIHTEQPRRNIVYNPDSSHFDDVPSNRTIYTNRQQNPQVRGVIRGALGVVPPNTPTGINVDQVATTSLGILGSASLLNPTLAPIAAAAGLGYGAYKLGETFHFW